MDIITLSSGSDESDSDEDLICALLDDDALPVNNEQMGATAAPPLRIDLSERRRWSARFLRRYNRRKARNAIEAPDCVNGSDSSQTDRAANDALPNGSDVGAQETVAAKPPCPATDESTHPPERTQPGAKRHKRNTIFSYDPQLRILVQKYLFKRDIYQEGDIQSTPPEERVCPPERSPCHSGAGAAADSAQEDRAWSPVSSVSPPHSSRAGEACGSGDGSVTQAPESNPSDSTPPAHGKQTGSNGHDPSPRGPCQRSVVQYLKPLSSSGPFSDTTSHADDESPDAAAAAGGAACGRRADRSDLCGDIPGAAAADGGRGWCLQEAMTESYYGPEDDADGPVLVHWHDGSEAADDAYEDRCLPGASPGDRRYVCPVQLQKLLAQTAPYQDVGEDEEGAFGTAQVLRRQSLRLVYSTIEEGLPDGTVQLLSDLLQPGFFPPKDITAHLLRGILLGPRSPRHLRVRSFDLLMRTQRHHRADRSTIPWDWDLLSSVMDNQEVPDKGAPCEVVRMLLDYVVLTVEDDFRAKLASAALKQSIARAFLSCNSQITKVREVIKWLCAAIEKSTAGSDGAAASPEADDHLRMVSAFQTMLRVALEVDGSPVPSSGRLAQELFHTLLIVVPLRSHRKLLLDSLQSELLKCKLLQHLLEHSCPEKTPLPMSLGLLLHFLKHSTPSQEPTDGVQRWLKWEELIELLWMLLFSYNKVNKGDLRRPITETREHSAVAAAAGEVSRPAVCEAVESLLARSRADLQHVLPDHIEESLSYLQDHLLDSAVGSPNQYHS